MSTYKKFKQTVYNTVLVPIIRLYNLFQWKRYLKNAEAINLIVGAGGTEYQGWFATDIWTLNIVQEGDFKKYFSQRKINKILAEHVLEHLSNSDLESMLNNFYKYSAKDINIRIAVPDGFHKNQNYIDRVKPGGFGEGAFDHKNLFTYKSLSQLFTKVGFKANPIEYWDENGNFHAGYKNDEFGYISRSFLNDERNNDGKPNYTSLIIDFTK
ncbi:MAG: hypothetical protein KF721_03350 [Ignavibacteriaceae bacterium]|nr:hypothetical protein [Ignavibacteriaceae bacterium]